MKKILKSIYKLFGVSLPTLYNKICFKLSKVKYGKGLRVCGKVYVRNRGVTQIGNNVTINSNISSNPSGGPYKTAIVTFKDAKLQIGNNVGISGTTIVAQRSIEIEDDVMLGSGCCVYDTDFHSVEYENRMKKPDDNVRKKPVKICKGAFVGARSIILKGVTIGEHSVVGAGSVVRCDIPSNEIWAGNPAQFIKNLK